jgi:hypothetical protein
VTSPSFANYQGVILAEFVLAELLISGTPIVTRQNKTGLSPYIPRDMTKMLSVGLLYFLLELSAVGNAKWGRMGAWFGGLILLAVGLNEAASVTQVLNLFGGGSADPAAQGPNTGQGGTTAADTGTGTAAPPGAATQPAPGASGAFGTVPVRSQ